MEQLENRMVLEEPTYIENDEYQNYLEHLLEEEDRKYEDEIFKEMNCDG